jgi:pyruvate dehydrogenase E1 component alpha subunit
VTAAVERGRAGEGATLIEAMTYRLGAHSTADDPTRYVPAQELEDAARRDPFTVAAAALSERGLLADGDADRIAEDARAAVARALEEAQAVTRPPLHEVLEELYERPPQRLRTQIATLAKELAHA